VSVISVTWPHFVDWTATNRRANAQQRRCRMWFMVNVLLIWLTDSTEKL